MENKILIELHVPQIEEVYSVFIPLGKTVRNVINLLENAVISLSNGSYHKSNVNLYVSGKLIDQGKLIKNSGITNGCHVVMI